MGSGWRIWLRERWRIVGATLAALLGVLIAVLIITGGPTWTLLALGNATAPHGELADGSGAHAALPPDGDPSASTGAPGAAARGDGAPRTSILDAPRAAQGPASIDAAQAGWSATERRQHQAELLRAYNCARSQHGLPPARLDSGLSQLAGDTWLKLARDGAYSLEALPTTFVLRGVLALEFTPPDAALQQEPDALSSGAPQGRQGCTVAGFDMTSLPAAPEVTTIGIAVFPPQTPGNIDGASAVILGTR